MDSGLVVRIVSRSVDEGLGSFRSSGVQELKVRTDVFLPSTLIEDEVATEENASHNININAFSCPLVSVDPRRVATHLECLKDNFVSWPAVNILPSA